MTPKKQPSNADLASKLDVAIEEIKTMHARVDALEQWKLAEDAYKSALKLLRSEEQQDRSNKLKDSEVNAQVKVLKDISKILGLVALGITAYFAGKGIH